MIKAIAKFFFGGKKAGLLPDDSFVVQHPAASLVPEPKHKCDFLGHRLMVRNFTPEQAVSACMGVVPEGWVTTRLPMRQVVTDRESWLVIVSRPEMVEELKNRYSVPVLVVKSDAMCVEA